jgi:hypothetical protein
MDQEGRIMLMKKKVPFILVSVTMLIMAWTQPLHALGEEAAPKASPLILTDHDFKPRLGTYFYCFEFNSMNIGSASIDIQKEGDLYKMQVSARTNNKIDYVYKIRYRGQSTLDMDPLSPKETKISQVVKSREKDVVISFQTDGSIQTREKVTEPGEPDDGDLRRIRPDRFTVDPFSATYLARGYDWKVGSEEYFDVYTGKKRYELHLKCTEKTQVDMGGYRRAAWVIVPTARLLDVGKKAQDVKKKPPEVKIYLSADDSKDVLKIEANHTLGTFLVFLDRFEPAGSQVKTVADK